LRHEPHRHSFFGDRRKFFLLAVQQRQLRQHFPQRREMDQQREDQRQPQNRDGHDIAAPLRRVVPVTHQVGIAAFLHFEANGQFSSRSGAVGRGVAQRLLVAATGSSREVDSDRLAWRGIGATYWTTVRPRGSTAGASSSTEIAGRMLRSIAAVAGGIGAWIVDVTVGNLAVRAALPGCRNSRAGTTSSSCSRCCRAPWRAQRLPLALAAKSP